MTTNTKRIDNDTDYNTIFLEAYSAYRKGLHSYAFSKTNNHALSDDLVQDTFIKSWKYLARKGQVTSMRALLYHILRHLILDEYRKHKPTSLDTLIEKGFEPSQNDYERICDISDGVKVAQLIRRLPKKYQHVLLMRYMQGLSLKEMSNITGQSLNTVAVQSHRGLEKLKTIYYQEQTSYVR